MSLAEFQLYSVDGFLKDTDASQHDVIKINIYASPEANSKYYWVKIQNIIIDEEKDFEGVVIVLCLQQIQHLQVHELLTSMLNLLHPPL